MKLNDELVSLMKENFSKNLLKFARVSGANLIERTRIFDEWADSRGKTGLVEFLKTLESTPEPDSRIKNYYGEECRGVNYGNQDYLSLSSHEEVKEAALKALKEFGPHSAGSGPLQGNTRFTRSLEEKLASMLKAKGAILYPTGWGAGFGAIVGLVQTADHILIDELSHQCLRQGAHAATKKVSNYRHLNTDMVEEKLKRIRNIDSKNGILVISEGLFSMDSDSPDVARIQELCHEYGATFLLDVAHDFGGTGPGGLGSLGRQDMVGKVDLVMGSFSKTFASNGGFVVCNSKSVINYITSFSGPYTFSNMLSPVQAAVVNKGMDIVQSPEGDRLREMSAHHIAYLRGKLTDRGLHCIGIDSPVVPLLVGDEKVALIANKLMFDKGVSANMIEFPGVPLGKARFRLQVMAKHKDEHADMAVDIIDSSIKEATEIVRKHFSET